MIQDNLKKMNQNKIVMINKIINNNKKKKKN